MTRKDLRGSITLIFFALVTSLLYNHLSPFGIALFGQWEPSKGVVSAIARTGSINASIEIVAIETIRKIVQEKTRTVIDVRPREIYDQGHLPSSLSFPLLDFDEAVPGILQSIPRQSALLVYCSSFECSDSHTFSERLINMKYENVKVFSGGFRQWQEMDYEIEKTE